jgi:hypothetical protein
MLEAEQLQKRLQIRQVELAFHLMGGRRHDVAVGDEIQRGMGCHQVLIEVGFLLGQGEAEPFGKDLVMAVAEGAAGDISPHDLAQRRVSIAASARIEQGGQKDEAAEVGWNSRKCFPPQFRGGSSSRFRFCDKIRQTPP